jgi:hypothetical protein
MHWWETKSKRQNNEEGRAKALSEERDIDGRHLSDLRCRYFNVRRCLGI